MNNEVVKFILENILENTEEVANLERNEFNDGKRLAYYEILNLIKNQLEINDIDLEEYGLNFTLEDLL